MLYMAEVAYWEQGKVYDFVKQTIENPEYTDQDSSSLEVWDDRVVVNSHWMHIDIGCWEQEFWCRIYNTDDDTREYSISKYFIL